MEMHADFHCFCCHKWLCKKPRACCDKRICDDCYEEIEGDWPVECPACYEPVVDKRDHYGRDFVASKQMTKNYAQCKVCSEKLCMSDLRGHEQECGGKGAEVKPKLIPFVKLQIPVLIQENEPEIECPFHKYGCQVKGTQVHQHLQEVPAPKTCFLAKLQDSAVKYAFQQAQEMDALLQQIQQLQH